MIRFHNISKSLNKRLILDDVSGTFEKGQTNLIVGPSGTGKSVLIKCIVGLIPPDTGEVYFDEHLFTSSNEAERAEIRRRIGMLFQGGALFDSQTVEENVRFPLDILTKMGAAEKRERVDFCLQRVGLENAHKKMPSEISGGMKKRVGIARAIVNNPEYLFCDEPNSGLDPKTALLIDELIQEITKEYNTTTIVVTHDISSMVHIGDNIMFLHQGKKVWEGNSKDIFHTNVKAFDDFFFSSKITNMLKEKMN